MSLDRIQIKQSDGSWETVGGDSGIGGTPGELSGFNLFQNWSWMTSAPLLDLSGVNDMRAMFTNCSSLVEIPQYDTSSANNMFNMFNGCSSLIEVPALDASSVSNTNSAFNGCSSLVRIRMYGMSTNLNVADTALEADALNELFENLAESDATITITGAPGADDCDPTIAENKGWTVE